MKQFINPPIVYSGNKYRLLNQLLPLFPSDSHTMVDLFCGGGSVLINTDSRTVYANDINSYLISFYSYLQNTPINSILEKIKDTIRTFKLDGHNRQGYNELRCRYNQTHNPIDLYVLIVNGFKDQIRFNNKGEFNTSFREGRVFNEYREQKLTTFVNELKARNITLSSVSFEKFVIPQGTDFVYIDPPYLTSQATYNDGKRGFNGWDKHWEETLLNYIEENIVGHGIRFALSNVLAHKSNTNEMLQEWCKRYNVHKLYTDTTTQGEQRHIREEILITNY